MNKDRFTRNFHVLTVKFLGPTNTKGARVKIVSERFEESVTINYIHCFNSSVDVAIDYLKNRSFNIVGKAESKTGFYIITDTFKGLKYN